MKVTYLVEVEVDPTLTPEAALDVRQQKNIVGAIRRLLLHRVQGLVGVETGLNDEIKWAIKVSGATVTPQSKV